MKLEREKTRKNGQKLKKKVHRGIKMEITKLGISHKSVVNTQRRETGESPYMKQKWTSCLSNRQKEMGINF